MTFLQKIRLIPIVLLVAGGLLALKLTGIIMDGGYTLGAGHQAIVDRGAREAEMKAIATRPVHIVRQDEQRSSVARGLFRRHRVGPGKAQGSRERSSEGKRTEEAAAEGEENPGASGAEGSLFNGTLVQVDANPMSASERALLERSVGAAERTGKAPERAGDARYVAEGCGEAARDQDQRSQGRRSPNCYRDPA